MDRVRWLLVDMNSYFASCEQQDRPELRGKPVAIVPLVADSATILAASYPAKAKGIKTGTRVGEAKRLCPEVEIVQSRHDLYVKMHHQVVEAVESVVPVHSVLSVDEMACRLTGSQQDPHRAVQLAEQVKDAIKRRVGSQMLSSVGLAPNRLLAKIASDMKKPDGLTVLLPSQLPQVLFSLRLRDFPGIGPKTEERFKQHGIHSVKQLCELNIDSLEAIWGGVIGTRYWQQLRGEDVALPHSGTQSLSHQHVLGPEKRTRITSQAVSRRLLTRLAVRLRREQFYTRKMSLDIQCLHQAKPLHGFVRFEETRDTFFLLQQLGELWTSVWKNADPEALPLKLGITFSDLVPEGEHQARLFESPKRDALNLTMDRINEKFGKDSVRVASVDASSAPAAIAFSRIPEVDEF